MNQILSKVINEYIDGDNPEHKVGYSYDDYEIESKGLWY